jgi:hypothetical protein
LLVTHMWRHSVMGRAVHAALARMCEDGDLLGESCNLIMAQFDLVVPAMLHLGGGGIGGGGPLASDARFVKRYQASAASRAEGKAAAGAGMHLPALTIHGGYVHTYRQLDNVRTILLSGAEVRYGELGTIARGAVRILAVPATTG